MTEEKILSGKTYLGIEIGSTRIKACLIDETANVIASGSCDWENQFEEGYWTYSLECIHEGIRGCFSSLSESVLSQYGIVLTSVGAIGISAMMHGYMVFDKNDNLLVPFRTWRNTTTETASKELSELFNFNIPQRFSISHLYQAMLNNEAHINQISHITTLAGYIHYLLTGKHEVGIGDASGIFPIKGRTYDNEMLEKFNNIVATKGYSWNIKNILPTIRFAGEKGSYLTDKGAKFLDPKGNLISGIPLCPAEGDAGTGMVATNSVLPKTGNVSAGTSIFSMLVLEKPLTGWYPEIDMVTTPDGVPVAMIHCNNCCSELDAWIKIFEEFAQLMGISVDKTTLYEALYKNALTSSCDCDGVVAYNYLSGEHITGIKQGAPMYFRAPASKISLASFIRAQLYSTMATLKLGMDILFEKEGVQVDVIKAHGGLFKVEGVAQQLLANALNVPVSVTKTSSEGGAFGIALLALYMMNSKGEALGDWLSAKVFNKGNALTLMPESFGYEGFLRYMEKYKSGLKAEKKLEEILC